MEHEIRINDKTFSLARRDQSNELGIEHAQIENYSSQCFEPLFQVRVRRSFDVWMKNQAEATLWY